VFCPDIKSASQNIFRNVFLIPYTGPSLGLGYLKLSYKSLKVLDFIPIQEGRGRDYGIVKNSAQFTLLFLETRIDFWRKIWLNHATSENILYELPSYKLGVVL
jgi:hypothetical protein